MTAKQVLVAGASGFLGSAVAGELRDCGFKVIGISRRHTPSIKNIDWLQGDITDSEFTPRALEGCEVVVNAVGKTGIDRGAMSSLEFVRVNCDAPAALARMARQAGVRKFFHVSSTGVFGPGAGECREDAPCEPVNPYERSKLKGEAAVLAETSCRMAVTVLRPSSVFGEGHPWNKLLTWLRLVRRGRAPVVGSTERSWVNYVYVGDVARAIAQFAGISIGEECEAHGATYIVNTPATMQEFLEASAAAVGVPARAFVVPKLPLAVMGAVFDVVSAISGRPLPLTGAKVRELTNRQVFVSERLKNWQPGFPYFGLREGLARTCAYYRERGLL